MTSRSLLPNVDIVRSRRWPPTRLLLATGAAGPPFFLALGAFVAQLDPAYDMRSGQLSELARGPGGWLMTVDFIVTGAAVICFAIGLRSRLRPGYRTGTALLVLSGLGLIGSGLFPTDLPRRPRPIPARSTTCSSW